MRWLRDLFGRRGRRNVEPAPEVLVFAWGVYVNEDADAEVHVIPLGDGWDHVFVDCLCGPTTEPVEDEEGDIGWLITHMPLDDREVLA